MKSQQDMIDEGYDEDWPTKCPRCGSFNCHEYIDRLICFDCKYKESK